MARVKLSAFEPATTLDGALLPIVQDGRNKRAPAELVEIWRQVRPLTGPLTDKGAGSVLFRVVDRLVAGAAAGVTGKSTADVNSTFVADGANLNSQWIERSATNYGVSPWGGIGVAGASRSSDQYAYFGYSVWASGQNVSVGAKRGYRQHLYVAASSGITGAAPPTHTVGTVSDGAVDWTFVDHTWQTPIAVTGIVMQDVSDGVGAWAGYFEAQRAAGAGTCFAIEIDTKNKGSNVTPDAYNHLPGGSTHGIWLAGGGDATLGAPANPSSAAIVIGKNATTWNVGICFEDDGLTPDGSGYMTAVAMGQKQLLSWNVAAGQLGANIRSEVTDATKKVQMFFSNDGLFLVHRSAAGFHISNQSGGNPANYIRADSVAAAAPVALNAIGTDADIDFLLTPKGAGKVRFGAKVAKAAEAFSDYFLHKMADGTTVKVMICT